MKEELLGRSFHDGRKNPFYGVESLYRVVVVIYLSFDRLRCKGREYYWHHIISIGVYENLHPLIDQKEKNLCPTGDWRDEIHHVFVTTTDRLQAESDIPLSVEDETRETCDVFQGVK